MSKTQTTSSRSAKAGDQRPGLDRLRAWFGDRGWEPHAFQEEVWAEHERGRGGLIQVPTGSGKTYAAYLGALADLIDEPSPPRGLRILYISPLRALSRDIEAALRAPVEDLGLGLRVESRTGDTSSSVRSRQRSSLPQVLVTTPESLTLLLTQETAASKFAHLRTVIVDEWHELLSSKRGSQVELALARLRRFAPGVQTWALSATVANTDDAARAAVGVDREFAVVRAPIDRPVAVDALLPASMARFPWAGHMGLSMLDAVLADLDPGVPTLVFVNTRSQAERWFNAISLSRPEWEGRIALHHGSIDKAARERVEAGIQDGRIGIVVCTSSLDLGVDFAPVERVMQIGSPKGVARLMQRAGRAKHRPGAPCGVTCVPAHALELIEIAAARDAIDAGRVEPRDPVSRPLDVLAQHMVTIALGGGFTPDDLFDEIRAAWSFRELTREEFDWTLLLVKEGGGTLSAYDRFRKIEEVDGLHRVPSKRIAQLHRFNVGTITGPTTIELKYIGGASIGHIEDGFVGRLREGEHFYFAGKTLRFVRMKEDVALVRSGTKKTNLTPVWGGIRLPISESLSAAVRGSLDRLADVLETGDASDLAPELEAVLPVVRAQAKLSAVPREGELLVEVFSSREGHRVFVYPFEGRLVHAGLSALMALRLGRIRPATFTATYNDYGFELLCPEAFPFGDLVTSELFSRENLVEDALESVNTAELAKLQFREIARVAGLVFQNYPGSPKVGRQLQASSSLIFDVLAEFDPDNLLLAQARREVLENQFEQGRLAAALDRLGGSAFRVVELERPSPLALPLVIERIGAQTMSSESLEERVARMQAQLIEASGIG
ncbi:MAG: ligase-associated DNA damage response DEXH box helicase [Planctomycetota bacterium]